ncbi:hypothetical protein GCM10009738_79340 [Kitasatospora viridis]
MAGAAWAMPTEAVLSVVASASAASVRRVVELGAWAGMEAPRAGTGSFADWAVRPSGRPVGPSADPLGVPACQEAEWVGWWCCAVGQLVKVAVAPVESLPPAGSCQVFQAPVL